MLSLKEAPFISCSPLAFAQALNEARSVSASSSRQRSWTQRSSTQWANVSWASKYRVPAARVVSG